MIKTMFPCMAALMLASGMFGGGGSAWAGSIPQATIHHGGTPVYLNGINITHEAPNVNISGLAYDATNGATAGVLFLFTVSSAPAGAGIDQVYVQNLSHWVSGYPVEDTSTSSPSPLIKWQTGGTPAHLPGSVGIFTTDTTLNSSAVNGPPSNGVGNAETLGLFYKYGSGVTFANVRTALGDYNMSSAAGMTLGFHVQGLGNGLSDSYVMMDPPGPGPSAVPVPAAAWSGLSVLGLLGVTAMKKRRKLWATESQ